MQGVPLPTIARLYYDPESSPHAATTDSLKRYLRDMRDEHLRLALISASRRSPTICARPSAREVYGGDRPLRLRLESRAQSFVLAVKKSEPLWWNGPTYVRADKIAQAFPSQAWLRLSAGIGAKGERLYDWALTPLWRLQLSDEERRFGHYLLIRRSLDD